MTIRPARFTDRAAIASVCTAAFFDEDLFGRVLHPHRKEYPDDVQLYWHDYLRKKWFNWRNQIFVAVDDNDKVVGIAIWQRQGEGGKHMELSQWDPRNLAQSLLSTTALLTSPLYPNRALDPTKSTILDQSFPFIAHHWSGPRSENWYLDLLSVHPDAQGHGFGKQLVEMGTREADRENICASVIVSDGKEGFYRKCGFVDLVGRASEGEGNPLGVAEAKGGAILFREPRGMGGVVGGKSDS